MTGDVTQLIVWASGVSTLLALATTIWNLLTSGSRSNAKVIDAQAKRIDEIKSDVERRTNALEHDVERLKTRIEQSPDQASMHRLELIMSDMRGQLEVLTERLGPIKATADRLQEWSLAVEKGGR